MKNDFTRPTIPFQYIKPAALIAVFLTIVLFSHAQINTLSGKVVDERTKLPLVGATIILKGSTHQVITGDRGEFTFVTAQHLPLTYVVSYVGLSNIRSYAKRTRIF
jgi:hypothetical protein